MTSFPASLDTFLNPGASTARSAAGFEHDVQHSNLNDAMAALQTKVGVNGSADANSVDNKLSRLMALILGANGQFRIQLVGSSEPQLQIWDTGFQKYVPLTCANGILGGAAYGMKDEL